MHALRPQISPLGDSALVITFAAALDDAANRAAIAAAGVLAGAILPGVGEIVPNLVSVYVGYDPAHISFRRLSGEIALVLGKAAPPPRQRDSTLIATRYDGPHLGAVAAELGLTVEAFIARHAAARLRVLAIGFAPGFAYCGLHAPALTMPRRRDLTPVTAGAVLFAAGQTALCATPLRTGWSVIGHTDRLNFRPNASPPVELTAGTPVQFPALSP